MTRSTWSPAARRAMSGATAASPRARRAVSARTRRPALSQPGTWLLAADHLVRSPDRGPDAAIDLRRARTAELTRRYGKRRQRRLGRLAGTAIAGLVLLFAAAPAQAAFSV